MADQQELLARGVVALERIANALEAILPAPVVEPTPGELECQHPLADRIDFGITNGVEDWQCGLCGKRSVAEAEETIRV